MGKRGRKIKVIDLVIEKNPNPARYESLQETFKAAMPTLVEALLASTPRLATTPHVSLADPTDPAEKPDSSDLK